MQCRGRKGKRKMKITDVRMRKVAKEGKLKAIVSITLDDEFAVHDIKIIEGDRGLFIAMPSKKVLDGEYRDIAHPINSEVRERVQSEILRKYQEMLDSEETEVRKRELFKPLFFRCKSPGFTVNMAVHVEKQGRKYYNDSV